MIKPVRSLRWYGVSIASWALIVPLGTGCSFYGDPFTDPLAHQPPVTTPSVVAARAATVEPVEQRRPFEPISVSAKDGTVTHGPLYYEDSFVYSGSDNGTYAWTDEDFLYWLYGPLRYIFDTAFYPISAVRRPPWLLLRSDGSPSQRIPEGWKETTDPMDQVP